jgi:hypothetical protein
MLLRGLHLPKFALFRRIAGLFVLLLLVMTIMDWQSQSKKIAQTLSGIETHYAFIDLEIIEIGGIVQSITLIFCFLPDLFFRFKPLWNSENERIYWKESSRFIYYLRSISIFFYCFSFLLVVSLPVIAIYMLSGLRLEVLIVSFILSVITYLIYFSLSRIALLFARKYKFNFECENDRPN